LGAGLHKPTKPQRSHPHLATSATTRNRQQTHVRGRSWAPARAPQQPQGEVPLWALGSTSRPNRNVHTPTLPQAPQRENDNSRTCVGKPRCSTTGMGVVLGTPGGGRAGVACAWPAAWRVARPPRPRGWRPGAAWAAVGGAGARATRERLPGRRLAGRLCGARAPPRGHARGRHVRRGPAAAIPLVSSYRIGGLVSYCT